MSVLLRVIFSYVKCCSHSIGIVDGTSESCTENRGYGMFDFSEKHSSSCNIVDNEEASCSNVVVNKSYVDQWKYDTIIYRPMTIWHDYLSTNDNMTRLSIDQWQYDTIICRSMTIWHDYLSTNDNMTRLSVDQWQYDTIIYRPMTIWHDYISWLILSHQK